MAGVFADRRVIDRGRLAHAGELEDAGPERAVFRVGIAGVAVAGPATDAAIAEEAGPGERRPRPAAVAGTALTLADPKARLGGAIRLAQAGGASTEGTGGPPPEKPQTPPEAGAPTDQPPTLPPSPDKEKEDFSGSVEPAGPDLSIDEEKELISRGWQ